MNDSMLARVNTILLKLVAQAYLDGKITKEMGEVAQVMGGLIDVYIEASSWLLRYGKG